MTSKAGTLLIQTNMRSKIMSRKTLIIGKKAILDAIKNNSLCEATISNHDKNFFTIVSKHLCDKLIVNNDKTFYDKKVSKSCNHQLAIGYIRNDSITNLDSLLSHLNTKKQATILVLDSIHDPHNFGSIIRSGESFGVDAIIYRKDRQCQITPIVRKISTGAISNVNLISVVNLHMAIMKLKENSFWTYASCLENTDTKLQEVKFAPKTVLIIGNEQKGISKVLLDSSDFRVKIATSGKTQSLNAAIATGILLYAKSCQTTE